MSDKNNGELLPCPFCGGEAVCDTTVPNGDVYRVLCSNEQCQGGLLGVRDGFLGHGDATTAWNTRTPSPVIEAAREVIAACEDYITLLGKELGEVSGLAYVHGWRSSRTEAGEEGRKRITEAKTALAQHDRKEGSDD